MVMDCVLQGSGQGRDIGWVVLGTLYTYGINAQNYRKILEFDVEIKSHLVYGYLQYSLIVLILLILKFRIVMAK